MRRLLDLFVVTLMTQAEALGAMFSALLVALV
jgi:hypothetical protein